MTEAGGRAVTWNLDDLYRLTNETVTNNPVSSTSPNYNAGYSYDPVGNRQTRTTSPTGILPDQGFSGSYDSNDRLTASGYGYNSNGSTTTGPNGWTYGYDAENHLLSVTGNGVNISYVYDGDGIRVMKNTNGTIVRYLTDDNSLTGYSQVLEELNGGYGLLKRYVYGLNLISRTDTMGTAGMQYYGYDGISSVRLLTDTSGNLTDTYDYDAFGTLIYHNGTTANVYLFQGQQYDLDLGQYYLRARYMNADLGRFWSMDDYEGDNEKTITLQKYSFCSNNSINNIDPNGNDFTDATLAVLDVCFSSAQVKAPMLSATGGPDITQTLKNTLMDVSAKFQSWTPEEKISAAEEIRGLISGQQAWDIAALYMVNQRPTDVKVYIGGEECGMDAWGRTVAFNGQSYYASAVNYALWGKINSLIYHDAGKLGNKLDPNEYFLGNAIKEARDWKHFEYGDYGVSELEAEAFTQYGYTGVLNMTGLNCKPSGKIVSLPQFLWCWEPKMHFPSQDKDPQTNDFY